MAKNVDFLREKRFLLWMAVINIIVLVFIVSLIFPPSLWSDIGYFTLLVQALPIGLVQALVSLLIFGVKFIR
jgi:hypothetical protein